jgi:ubiquitin-conjugating enzyme E2 R
MSGETAAERWSPVQRVETVLISILSLLDDAEVSSPANVDAGVMLRNKPAEYKEMVKKDLELSKQDIPTDFVMPTHETAWRKEKDEGEFDMSWEDSDAESLDFGGSESDEDQEMDSDFGGDDDDDAEDEDMDDEDVQPQR